MNAPVASAPAHGQDKALLFLLQIWLASGLAALGLGLLTLAIFSVVPPMRVDELFMARFTVDRHYFYPGQPAKDMAFEMGALLAPFFAVAGYVIAQRWLAKLKPSWLPAAARLAVGVTWLIFMVCLARVVFCDTSPSAQVAADRLLLKWYWSISPFPTWVHFVSFGVGAIALLFFGKGGSTRQQSNRALLVLLSLWVILIPISFYSPVDFNDELRFTYHFNTVTDALSQAINGHHLLVQFSHIYGGYVEILAPLLALLPRNLATLMDVFPVLNALAVLALLLTARLVIPNSFFLLVTGMALLALVYLTSSYDHYYANTPIRLLFPALGLLASALYFRQPSIYPYLLVSFLAAIATVWNLDSGLALWLSWSATLLVRGLGQGSWKQAAQNVAAQLGYLAATWMTFLLYLRIVSGVWPDLQMLVVFLRLFLGSGYLCVLMNFPDAWVISVLISIVALVVTAGRSIHQLSTWRMHFSLMLSLLGIGLFHYFVGRSVEGNLIAVSYPTLLLLGILFSETQSMIAEGRLPRITWSLLLPAIIVLGWWALFLPTALPSLLVQSAVSLHKLCSTNSNSIETNAAFISQTTVPGEGVCLLSNQSGIYYYLSDTVRPIPIPGTAELFLTKDMDALISAIDQERLPKLFLDQNFEVINIYRSEFYRRIRNEIAQHYQAHATSPSGQITLYLPR